MPSSYFFLFTGTATTEIYTLSLHDALPIWERGRRHPKLAPLADGLADAPRRRRVAPVNGTSGRRNRRRQDRKSTRLNSSHRTISYAVFCLKKKKQPKTKLANHCSYMRSRID